MATRFPELNDEELLELLDDKLSDRSKNMIMPKYSVAVLPYCRAMQRLVMVH